MGRTGHCSTSWCSLPDICGALESNDGQASGPKHIAWCRRYCPRPPEILDAEDYRDIRNLVLHQGRTLTRKGRQYKFTKPTAEGARLHRCVSDGGAVVVLDVDSLSDDLVAAMRAWFVDLQTPQAARVRNANVVRNLPTLVMAQEQELPIISGSTFAVMNTCSPWAPTVTTASPPPSGPIYVRLLPPTP